MTKGKVEQICKNCKLFNRIENTCLITMIHEGVDYELKRNPEDKCHWIETGLIKHIEEFELGDSQPNGLRK